MIDDTSAELLVFMVGIRQIHDPVRSFLDTDASEAILRRLYHVAVDEVRGIIHVHLPEEAIVHIESCGRGFIDPACIFAKRRDIVTVL